MRISFDLDDTLFVNPEKIKAFPFSVFYPDRLRAGTVSLMTYLSEQKIEIWIYTTSFRSETYIRNLFRHYHIHLTQIVNGSRHLKEVQGMKTEIMPSKYPSHYRIDLHIDDDKSVLEKRLFCVFNSRTGRILDKCSNRLDSGFPSQKTVFCIICIKRSECR